MSSKKFFQMETNSPKIAIIVLNWNGWRNTVECLESLQRIDYPCYEIIVVDNGSTDNSVKMIKKWGEGDIPTNTKFVSFNHTSKPVRCIQYERELAEEGGDGREEEFHELPSHRKLTIICTRENLGFAGGCNVGMRYALKRGDFNYILILNNDTVVAPDFLIRMVGTGEMDDKLGIIGGRIYYYDNPQIIWYGGGKFSLWKASGYHEYYQKPDEQLEREINLKNLEKVVGATFITGCLMLIREELLQDLGLFREDYFLSAEDTDFCYRALKNHWKMSVNLQAKIWHKVGHGDKVGHAKEREASLFNTYYETRNRLFFASENIKKAEHRMIFILFFVSSRLIRILMWGISGKNKLIKGTVMGVGDFLRGKKGKGGECQKN